MRIGLGLTMLGGIALAVGLIVYLGTGAVLGTLADLGWGIVPIVLVHIVQLWCCGQSWRALIPPTWPRPAWFLTNLRWIREGTNGLLPVAHVGGEIIGARLLSFRGVRGDVAGASVVVDLTVEVVTQVFFTLAGVAMLLGMGRGGQDLVRIGLSILIGVLAIAGFVLAQRVGLFKLIESALDRMMKTAQWLSLDGVRGLHEAIQEMHGRPRALAESGAWHVLSWVLGTLEVWFALVFMGIPVGLREAFILESLGQAARSAGFAVPSGVGVQEAGYLATGAMLGLAPEAALALSLAKRLREVGMGLPSLLAWLWLEGRRLWRHRPGAAAARSPRDSA